MPFLKGRGVRVEVALTYAASKSVTAVTAANPGVATSTAHAMTNGTVGYFTGVTTGMVQLDGQAARAYNISSNSFDLQGLNTANYSAFSGTASFIPVATWATLAECDSYDLGGGAADKLNTTCLIDNITQEENGNLAAQSVTLNIKATDVASAAMAFLEAQAQAGVAVVVRITYVATGAVRVFRGEPSLPSESLSTGAVGTGSMQFSVKGVITRGAA
jgi:hypothetical protein